MDQPVGLLQSQPLGEAKELLLKIRTLLLEKQAESSKTKPSGEKLQDLGDQVAEASNRIYELMPTRNFKHSNVAPIDNFRKLPEWEARIEMTSEIAEAARLLLGAQ